MTWKLYATSHHAQDILLSSLPRDPGKTQVEGSFGRWAGSALSAIWRMRTQLQDCLILILPTYPAQQCLVPSLATSCLLLMSFPGIPAGLLRSREEKHVHMSIACSALWWVQGLCADNEGKSLNLGRSTIQMCISPPSSCLLPFDLSQHMQMISYMQVLYNAILEGGKVRYLDRHGLS